MQLVQYFLETGQLAACYDTEVSDLLAAQVIPGDTTYGYLEIPTPLGLTEQDRYEVIGGALQPKSAVVLTATPSPFAGDGVTECQVVVSPFVPCILVINGQEVVLTSSDPVVILTADSPQVFEIRLKRMPSYWAAPLRVEAS